MMRAILKSRDPWFQPKPKQSSTRTTPPANVSVSSANITMTVLVDDELETVNRLLKKVGVPDQALLQPGEPDVIDMKAGK